MTTPAPTWRAERALWRAGHARVAGVDEVGRGPLAGPVVAGAVVLPASRASWLRALRDSKVLCAAAREELAAAVRAHADWGIGVASSHVIDEIGIVQATRLAMRRAVLALHEPADALIVDGREVVTCGLPQRAIVGADALCVSVAAASIVAKVARDAMMRAWDAEVPGYGFAEHKGYATAVHRAALARLGPSTLHRLTWAPVRAAARGLAAAREAAAAR
ncbi:MAG: ribonuclease HII [Dehalococcoidia bacterium]|nr:ribonuclease HII [Dehalococcoidia bacterium]